MLSATWLPPGLSISTATPTSRCSSIRGAQSQIHQGVTTELVGNCGHGCAPITDDIDLFTGNIYGYQDLIDIDREGGNAVC